MRTLSFFHPSRWTGNCHSHQGAFSNLLALIYDYNTAPVQMVLPSCDRYSTHVQTLLPSGGPISSTIVTVADCAGRPSRTRDLSLGRRVRYQFTKEVTSLERPVHTLPAQCHSATLLLTSIALLVLPAHIVALLFPPAHIVALLFQPAHIVALLFPPAHIVVLLFPPPHIVALLFPPTYIVALLFPLAYIVALPFPLAHIVALFFPPAHIVALPFPPAHIVALLFPPAHIVALQVSVQPVSDLSVKFLLSVTVLLYSVFCLL